ncbi:MAG: FAD-dependent oxidoreductase [Lachnospiraceae bacterium]|nr:FAD-dependent oxidoreductase [Lachnospiraceae bacterium]
MITISQLKTEIIFEKNLEQKEVIDNKKTLVNKAVRALNVNASEISDICILKHSIDARKKPLLFHVYTLGVSLKSIGAEERAIKRCKSKNISLYTQKPYTFAASGERTLEAPPVIIGMGPAGLFCGYMLAKHGYRPILLERGYDVDTRTRDVEAYWNGGSLNPESNVQFGEGGAGTFSDGKLNTLVRDKNGRNKEVLRIFAEFGASEQILYESKPHIGTDVLKNIVSGIRNYIIDNGGIVRFGTKVTGLETDNGALNAVIVNDKEYIKTTQAVLAIGHSARDTFAYLDAIHVPMEAKAFAVGMRVEHPQSLINECMYGSEHGNALPAAPYKLTAQTGVGRGVYSFCMCPGGYVVNASSEPGCLAVNGMSYSDRKSGRANSAIIVQVFPEDYGADGPLAGVEFQRQLERKAFELGHGKVPVQYYGDYLKNVASCGCSVEECEKLCIKGAYTMTNIRGLLPENCEKAFMEGMEQFDRTIPGFAGNQAVLSGIESRTSSPVRICRDENLQCPTVKGLYPCGEGAGYAGGITSAAMDGILIAETIAAQFKPFLSL